MLEILKANDKLKIIKGRALERIECWASKLARPNVNKVIFTHQAVLAWDKLYTDKMPENTKSIYEDKIVKSYRKVLDQSEPGWYDKVMFLKGTGYYKDPDKFFQETKSSTQKST